MSRWTVADARPEETLQIDDFAARAWDEYHHDEGHEPDVDWASHPVTIIARDERGLIVGLARGDVSASVGHLSELLVAPERRKSGLGSVLLAAFEERCWARGCHKLTLHTEFDGPARLFYERRGWQFEAVHRRDKAGLDFVRLVKFRDYPSNNRQ